MEAVLPSNVNYLDTLPRGVPAERKRKNFFAANGTQYRPGQTAIIEISDPRCFLDPVNSFLRFRFSFIAFCSFFISLSIVNHVFTFSIKSFCDIIQYI